MEFEFIKSRFLIASAALLAIFCINLYGLYGNGFVQKYYLIPESEHLVAGFFVAMWLSGFSHSLWFILIGLTAVTVSWELLEYFIAVTPGATKMVQANLKITDTSVDKWDTVLDVFLNFMGTLIFIFLDKKFKR